MSHVAPKASSNPTPEPGQRLQLGVVAAALQVSTAELADHAGVSKTTMLRLMSNEWPARTCERDRQVMRDQVEALLRARGATDEQISTLWHGAIARHYRARSGPPTQDGFGRDHAPKSAQPNPDEEPMLLPKQSLSPLARRHFKMSINPFDGEVQTDDDFFEGGDFRYVREAAWQCCQTSGFVAIVGESGAGKTTVLADLEARLQREGRGVIVIRPGVLGMEESSAKGQLLKSTDILHAVITTLQPEATVPQTLQARTVRAAKMLTASTESGAQHLLLIEEGHSLPDATLKHLKRLHEMRHGRRSLLGILLLAQPELKARLANGLRTGALREVAQRCEIVELLPLDGELKAYLQHRLACVAEGRPLADLIDDAAIDQLRTRLTRKTAAGTVSMCYPLAVHNLVTRALNLAAELGAGQVTADIVKGA